MKEKHENIIKELKSLFNSHNIRSIPELQNRLKDESFNHQWQTLWHKVGQEHGGKLTFTAIGTIIGASLGGVGIAAMGGAVGLPLFIVLGAIGLASGTITDLSGITKKIVNFFTGAETKNETENIQEDLSYLAQKVAFLEKRLDEHVEWDKSRVEHLEAKFKELASREKQNKLFRYITIALAVVVVVELVVIILK